MQWIKALRLPGDSCAALLVAVSFRLSGKAVDWYAAATTLGIFAFAMVWNDYVDRDADVAKGRLLAHENPRRFLIFVTAVGVISGGACAELWHHARGYGLLSITILLIAGIYPFVQRHPYVKNSLVALASAATVMYPAMNHEASPVRCGLFLFVFLVISSREHIKDIEDMQADTMHKRTIALVYGQAATRWVAAAGLITAALVAYVIRSPEWSIPWLVAGSIALVTTHGTRWAKTAIDIGVTAFIASVLLR